MFSSQIYFRVSPRLLILISTSDDLKFILYVNLPVRDDSPLKDFKQCKGSSGTKSILLHFQILYCVHINVKHLFAMTVRQRWNIILYSSLSVLLGVNSGCGMRLFNVRNLTSNECLCLKKYIIFLPKKTLQFLCTVARKYTDYKFNN